MNSKNFAILLVLIAFSALSGYALLRVGYIGIFRSSFTDWGTIQVLCDLIITCSLAMLWMLDDAHRRGLNAWPFVIVTVLAGSFGPLLYLLRRGLREPLGA